MLSETETLLSIEEAAYAAWPPLVSAEVDGWRLRAAQGVTGRANSVWAMRDGGRLSAADKVAAAEEFYASHSLPPRFQINRAVAPAGLDVLLAERGYTSVSPTCVQAARLDIVLQRTPALRLLPGAAVELSEEYEEGWFDLYRAAAAMSPHVAQVRATILRQIAAPVGFAQLAFDDVPAAIGLGVVGGSWLGIFCMETLPDFRRRGAATALLRALCIWGAMYGADTAYLQVTAGNAPAQAAYARAGFATAYDYHYRVKE